MSEEAEKIEPQSIEARIDAVGQELLATAFSFLERRRKRVKIPEEEIISHKEQMDEFKNLERIYNSLKRMNRVGGNSKPAENFDAQVLAKIKAKESSLGSIVRNPE